MTTVADKAVALAEAGFYVFPTRLDKTPYSANGLKDASNDPWHVREWFEKYGDRALPAIHCGLSGIVVLDIDYKQDGVDGFESLEESWLEIPQSFDYPSVSGLGKHIMYTAPEGKNLAPKAGYRKMAGVDRRSGESYVVYPGEVIPNRDALSPAPEWLCDESAVRSTEQFEGDVKAWYETLEPGPPNVMVRRAMDDAAALYEQRGNDFSHSDIIELQHRAIRMGAEGATGIPEFLAILEDLALSREGSHSRSSEEYGYEFAEGLASGIAKHGAAIELRTKLPEYSFNVVPTGVPEQLVLGESGDKSDFRNLLASLIAHTEDDYLVTTVLWNAPKTRDISREWGLEFVYERVTSARNKPEPVRENPAIPEVTVDSKPVKSGASFLTAAEEKRVKSRTTFIDRYLAASATKGFVNPAYDVPAAWTALSMALGRRAFIPLGKNIGVNIWHIVLGESSTGKSSADAVLKTVLDILMSGNEVGYSLGAKSSPAALSEALLLRDGLPSIVHHDEAADFFRNISEPGNWMADVPDLQAKWYEGWVDPENKVRLSKELKGKSARTSFNKHMLGTPDRVIRHLSADQFESGYLARVNWTWNRTKGNISDKYNIGTQENGDDSEIPMAYVNLAGDLASLRGTYRVPVKMVFSDAAQARLRKAYQDFDEASKDHPRYENFSPSITRLGSETIWKCAALLALYRGDAEVELDDVLTSIYYASEWLRTLHLIASEVSESMYSRDLEEIESFIREEGGSVSRAKLLHQFRGKVVRSGRELEDRVSFLLESGRVNREQTGDKDVLYRLNGG